MSQLAKCSISEQIIARIQEAGARAFGNDNVAKFIHDGELELLQKEVEEKFREVLKAMLIDVDNDHNAVGTPKRFAKMMLHELYRGRYHQEPDITEFPNVTQADEMYVVGPITIRSACAHHMAPITGSAWVGIIPSEKLIGLSKFHRIIDHIGSRAQIQEEMTMQVADAIEALTAPAGLAVLVKAHHQCCSHRGVKDKDSHMVTSVTRGVMRTHAATRDEFFRLVDLTK